MSSEPYQVLRSGLDRVQEVDSWDGAGAPATPVALERDQDNGTVESLDQPRGDDSDHPGVPSLARQDDPEVGVRVELLGETVDGLFQCGAILVPSEPIHALEVAGQTLCFPGVGGEQQPQCQIRVAHPSDGVDARAEHESHLTRLERGSRLESRRSHQSPKPRFVAVRQIPQTEADEHPVLARQGHEIGHGRQGDEIQMGP